MSGVYGDFKSTNQNSRYNRRQQGVFGEYPLATPKYALNRGQRDAEYRETLARMFISLANTNESTRKAYLASLPNDPRVKALAQVLIGNGNPAKSTGFIDFFLQQVNEGFQEKVQVDEVLGDNYVAWYFGQAPPVFQYAGTLLNSMQDDQVTGFALAYQHLIRGTALGQRGTLLRLRYDNVIVSGTVNSMSRSLNAESEMACPFNFSLLVKEMVFLKMPQFTRMQASDYVQLQTVFAKDAQLGLPGQASDTRVRTTTVLPPQLRSVSSAGQEEPAEPVSDGPAPQQVDQAVSQQTQSPVTTDVLQSTSSLQSNPPPESNANFTPGA